MLRTINIGGRSSHLKTISMYLAELNCTKCFDEIIPNFCHVFHNGWTISTPNFSPKATSNHELWRAKVCHLSQTSVMCSIMAGLSKGVST